ERGLERGLVFRSDEPLGRHRSRERAQLRGHRLVRRIVAVLAVVAHTKLHHGFSGVAGVASLSRRIVPPASAGKGGRVRNPAPVNRAATRSSALWNSTSSARYPRSPRASAAPLAESPSAKQSRRSSCRRSDSSPTESRSTASARRAVL